jgi:hypothetical protein
MEMEGKKQMEEKGVDPEEKEEEKKEEKRLGQDVIAKFEHAFNRQDAEYVKFLLNRYQPGRADLLTLSELFSWHHNETVLVMLTYSLRGDLYPIIDHEFIFRHTNPESRIRKILTDYLTDPYLFVAHHLNEVPPTIDHKQLRDVCLTSLNCYEKGWNLLQTMMDEETKKPQGDKGERALFMTEMSPIISLIKSDYFHHQYYIRRFLTGKNREYQNRFLAELAKEIVDYQRREKNLFPPFYRLAEMLVFFESTFKEGIGREDEWLALLPEEIAVIFRPPPPKEAISNVCHIL